MNFFVTQQLTKKYIYFIVVSLQIIRTKRCPMYDKCYKSLFSNPEMVKDLLIGFLNADWVCELNFDTLERVNTMYISDKLHERESDIVWKIKWRGNDLYILILIEFQSTIDSFMAVRMLAYIALLYQDIIKQDVVVRNEKKLPPVLPLVLYNGEQPWNAPASFEELMADNLPKLLKKYQPCFRYWILDEGRCIMPEEIEENNVVVPLIALEQSSQPQDMLGIVKRLVRRLKGPEFDSLRRSYTIYLNRSLQAKKILSSIEYQDLNEVDYMLSARIDAWQKQFEEEGRAKGFAEGLAKGEMEGELAVIEHMLEKRFGSALSIEQIIFLQNRSSEELLEISGRLLEANSIEEIFSVGA